MRFLIFTYFVALMAVLVTPQTALASCAIHDHTCQFHGIGRAFNPNVDIDSSSAVTIVTEGSNAVDFDNSILLPNGIGPYVISSTPNFPRRGAAYTGATELPRSVSTLQYQIDFQNNTAQATHSGDLNGASGIPNSTGCQISMAANCEEIRLVGNLPDPQDGVGFVVRQTNHLFNVQNTPNPSIELQSYAVATGQFFVREFSHAAILDEQSATSRNFDSLSGTGDLGDEHIYYIGNYGFEPHAIGVPVFYDQQWKTTSAAYEGQARHANMDSFYRDITTHNNQKFVSGEGKSWTDNYYTTTQTNYLYSDYTPEYKAQQAELKRQQANNLRLAEQRRAYCSQVGDFCMTPAKDIDPLTFTAKLEYPSFSNNMVSANDHTKDPFGFDVHWIENSDSGEVFPFLNAQSSFASKVYYGGMVAGGAANYTPEVSGQIGIGGLKEWQKGNTFITQSITSGPESIGVGSYNYIEKKLRGEETSLGGEIDQRFIQTKRRYDDAYTALVSSNEAQQAGANLVVAVELASGVKAIPSLVKNTPDALKGLRIISHREEVVDKTINISLTKFGETARHMKDAQKVGHPTVLTINREGADANRAASLSGISKITGKQLDEYPPAMFKEGGVGASVRPVDGASNMGVGASIGNQCRGLPCGSKVEILIIK